MIGGNRAIITDMPNVTIQFADTAQPDIHKKVLKMLIEQATADNDLEDYDETSSMSVSRFHGWAG